MKCHPRLRSGHLLMQLRGIFCIILYDKTVINVSGVPTKYIFFNRLTFFGWRNAAIQIVDLEKENKILVRHDTIDTVHWFVPHCCIKTAGKPRRWKRRGSFWLENKWKLSTILFVVLCLLKEVVGFSMHTHASKMVWIELLFHDFLWSS